KGAWRCGCSASWHSARGSGFRRGTVASGQGGRRCMSMLSVLSIMSAYRALTRRGSGAAQRGQALVEFSMVFIIIMFLIAGIVDIGGLLSDHVSLEYAARTGARTASVLSNKSTSADCAIVGAIDTALTSMPNVQLSQITIYQADSQGQSTGNATVYQAPIS